MAVHSSVPVWLSDSTRVIHEPALDTQAGAGVGNEIQPLLSGSLKSEADETIFLELAHRGYNLLSLPDKTETDKTTSSIMEVLLVNEYKYYRKNTRHRVSRSQYLGAQRADRTLAQLEDEIIHVLKNARESGYVHIPDDVYEPDPNGGHAYIKATYIGKEIGTYRKHTPSSDDPLGRAHRKLLDKLQDEGRAEPLWSESGTKRIGWRLTESEWNRLTLDE